MDIREEIYTTQKKLSYKKNNLARLDEILTAIDGIIIFNNYINDSVEALKIISDSSEEMDKIETIADNSEYISLNAKHIIQLIKDGIDSGRI